MCFQALTNCINQSIVSEKFLNSLNFANISPAFKDQDFLDKTIDLSASYVFCQRYTKDRFLISYLGMPTRFSVSFCAVLEKTITQNALFRLLQSCQKALDNSEYVGTVLMDLSKAYDCIPHDLLIAKLEAYVLDKTSRHLLSHYLCDRKQRTKNSFHLQQDVICGIAQGSVLRPICFSLS